MLSQNYDKNTVISRHC